MKTDKALTKVALKHGVSVAEVRREIQAALDEGIRNPDPQIKEYWNSIPCKGDKPTVDEVISYLVKQIK